jgi:hypothetical protein
MKCRLAVTKRRNDKWFLSAEASRYLSASSVIPDRLYPSVSDTLNCETAVQSEYQLNSDSNETNVIFEPYVTNYNAHRVTLEGSWLRLHGKKWGTCHYIIVLLCVIFIAREMLSMKTETKVPCAHSGNPVQNRIQVYTMRKPRISLKLVPCW